MRGVLVSLCCGILFSASYVVLLDAGSYSQLLREGNAQHLIPPVLEQPAFRWYYALPVYLSTFLCVLLNLSSAAHLYGGQQHSLFKNWRDLGYFMAGAFLIAGYLVPLYLHHMRELYLSATLLSMAGGTSIICSVLVFIRFFGSEQELQGGW